MVSIPDLYGLNTESRGNEAMVKGLLLTEIYLEPLIETSRVGSWPTCYNNSRTGGPALRHICSTTLANRSIGELNLRDAGSPDDRLQNRAYEHSYRLVLVVLIRARGLPSRAATS